VIDRILARTAEPLLRPKLAWPFGWFKSHDGILEYEALGFALAPPKCKGCTVFKPLRRNPAGHRLNETRHTGPRFTQTAILSPDPRCFDVTRACHVVQVF
jgi:hypothetical protein